MSNLLVNPFRFAAGYTLGDALVTDSLDCSSSTDDRVDWHTSITPIDNPLGTASTGWISFWVYQPDVTTAAFSRIMYGERATFNASSQAMVQLRSSGDGMDLRLLTLSGNDVNIRWSDCDITSATWYHIAIKFDGTHLGYTCYLDGTELGAPTDIGSSGSPNATNWFAEMDTDTCRQYMIGSSIDGTWSHPHEGYISYFQTIDGHDSVTIDDLYDASNVPDITDHPDFSTFSDLLLRLSNDGDDSATVADDTSPNDNDGTLEGGAGWNTSNPP